jgi:hypothetical protein
MMRLNGLKKPKRNRAKFFALVIIACAATVTLGGYTIFTDAARNLREQQYIMYVRGEYFTGQFILNKTWPRTLSMVESDLKKGSASGYSDAYADRILAIHRDAHPELIVDFADSTEARGRVKFHWDGNHTLSFVALAENARSRENQIKHR